MKAIIFAFVGMALSCQLQAQNAVAPAKTDEPVSPAKQAAMSHPERHPFSDAQKAQLKDQEEGPQSKSPGNSRAKRPKPFAPSTKSAVPQETVANPQ